METGRKYASRVQVIQRQKQNGHSVSTERNGTETSLFLCLLLYMMFKKCASKVRFCCCDFLLSSPDKSNDWRVICFSSHKPINLCFLRPLLEPQCTFVAFKSIPLCLLVRTAKLELLGRCNSKWGPTCSLKWLVSAQFWSLN